MFEGAPLKVRLVNAFARPFDNAVATARTCYSAGGVVTAEQVAGDGLADDKQQQRRLRRDDLARSIYEAGHHTTLQHAHFQFALEGVSRQFLWSFLHSHPFYNSEQVSQRYVEVKPDQVHVPPLSGEAREVYRRAVEALMERYRLLCDALTAAATEAFLSIWTHKRSKPESYQKDIQKKTQEVARYVLPLGTTAYLYHTVSGVTLLRYWRLCRHFDAPAEQEAVVRAMVDQVLALDEGYRAILEEPLDAAAMPEFAWLESGAATFRPGGSDAFRAEFDAALDGKVSALTGWSAQNERLVADGVREVLGLTRAQLDDEAAIARALDPAQNAYLGETLNVTTHTKVSRALHHAHYTFRKRISHTADSQDQRHRMTPASRPVLAAHLSQAPDFVTPGLIERSPEAQRLYSEAMDIAWEACGKLLALSADTASALYVLPNAVAVRFSESSDLLNLHHKHKMRLCYNAQEEIWKASHDEAEAVTAVNPLLGRFLQPPCTLRYWAKAKPICPEGPRFCGIPVWRQDRADHKRPL